jgi:hypothetical protein
MYMDQNTHTHKFQVQPSTAPPRGRNVAKITNHTSTAVSSAYGFPHTPAQHSDALRTAPSILRTLDVSILTLTTIAHWSLHYWPSSLRQIVFLQSARNWFSSPQLLRWEKCIKCTRQPHGNDALANRPLYPRITLLRRGVSVTSAYLNLAHVYTVLITTWFTAAEFCKCIRAC